MFSSDPLDNLHRLKSVTLPDPNATTPTTDRPTTGYTYTASGQIQTVTEAVTASTSRTTTYQYDALDRLVRLVSPDPSDGAGPSGGTYGWDPNRAEPDTDTPFTSYTYDAAGNFVGESNALDQLTTYEYDRLHRLVAQTRFDTLDPDAADEEAVTSFTYDLAGKLLFPSDPAIQKLRERSTPTQRSAMPTVSTSL